MMTSPATEEDKQAAIEHAKVKAPRPKKQCGYCWGDEPSSFHCICRRVYCGSRYCPYGPRNFWRMKPQGLAR